MALANKIDCGKYGMLTRREAAELSNVSYEAIVKRVDSGTFTKEEIIDGHTKEQTKRILRDTIISRENDSSNTNYKGHKKIYDCGKYGMLSSKEIAKLGNVPVDTVYQRKYIGYTKEELVEGRKNKVNRKGKIYDFGKSGKMTINEAAEKSGLNIKTIYARIHNESFSKDEILTIPVVKDAFKGHKNLKPITQAKTLVDQINLPETELKTTLKNEDVKPGQVMYDAKPHMKEDNSKLRVLNNHAPKKEPKKHGFFHNFMGLFGRRK